MKYVFISASLISLLSACGGGGDSTNTSAVTTPQATATPAATSAPIATAVPLPSAATENNYLRFTAGLQSPAAINQTMATYIASGTVRYLQDNTTTLVAAWNGKDILVQSGLRQITQANELANARFDFYYEKGVAEANHQIIFDATGSAIVNAPPDVMSKSMTAAEITSKLSGELKAYVYTLNGAKHYLIIDVGTDYLGAWSSTAPTTK